MLKSIWRFLAEWVAPFMAAGLVSFLLIAIGCVVTGMERDIALIVAIAAGVAIGIAALLVPPVRRWFATHASHFDPGSDWG